MTTLLITIHPARRGKSTTSIAGTPLVGRPTNNPEYDSCRELLRRGYPDGPASFIRVGSDVVASSVRSVHAAAKLTVVEDTTRGPRVGVYISPTVTSEIPIVHYTGLTTVAGRSAPALRHSQSANSSDQRFD